MKSKSLMCLAVIAFAIPALALKQDPEYQKARHEGAEAKFELRVVDDDDVQVAGAKAKVFMGMNYREKGYWLNGETNTNGIWILQGKTCGNEIEIGITRDGYYDSNRKMSLATMGSEHEVKDGKWQPWGAEERIVLRKIRNPIELKRQSVREYRDVDIINEWVGFDLERNDFVADNHMGKCSDFEVRFVWDGKWLPDYTGMTVEIRFPQKGSGGYWVEDCLESGFKWVYDAEINATYAKDFSFFEKMPKGCARTYKHFDANKSLVVRSRCVFDEKGNLEAANYACVDMLGFSCAEKGIASLYVISVFNPTPNDTNLEPKW